MSGPTLTVLVRSVSSGVIGNNFKPYPMGVPGLPNTPVLLFFELDGTRLLLDLGAPASLLCSVSRSTDVHATIEGLRADGVQVEHEPYFIYQHEDDTLGPSGMQEWHAFVRDTEGNLAGLVGYLNPATDQ